MLHIGFFFCYIYTHPVVSKKCGTSYYSLLSLLNLLELSQQVYHMNSCPHITEHRHILPLYLGSQ